MNKIYSFIDRCLIDDYADKDNYHLDVDDLPRHEIANFLDLLLGDDTQVRDFILYTMQKMIDERLVQLKLKDRYNKGYRTRRDPINGEVIIEGVA